MMDLVSHILDEEKTDDIDNPNRYMYDRIKWVKNNQSNDDEPYQIGLESLRVLVYQLGLFQKHIFKRDGKELEQLITEK